MATTDERKYRIANVSDRTHCRFCCDEGYVLVGWSQRGTDEMAPCPHCERGFAVEFPERGSGPWGERGYWRGRSVSGVEEICTHGALLSKPPPEFLDALERLRAGVAEREAAEEFRRVTVADDS